LSAAAYSIYLQLPSITGGCSSIRNPRTRLAVVTGNLPNMVLYIDTYIKQLLFISKPHKSLIFENQSSNTTPVTDMVTAEQKAVPLKEIQLRYIYLKVCYDPMSISRE
jgi:hypothetical protein